MLLTTILLIFFLKIKGYYLIVLENILIGLIYILKRLMYKFNSNIVAKNVNLQ